MSSVPSDCCLFHALKSLQDSHLLLTLLSAQPYPLTPTPSAPPAWDLEDQHSRACFSIIFFSAVAGGFSATAICMSAHHLYSWGEIPLAVSFHRHLLGQGLHPAVSCAHLAQLRNGSQPTPRSRLPSPCTPSVEMCPD